jgi:hypothetical protein
VEPGGLFTLILIGFCLIAFGYRCAVIILRKSSPDTGNDDVYLGDVLRTRALAEAEPKVSALRASIAIAEGKSRDRETFERGDGTSRAQPRRYAHKNEAIARSHKGDV